MLLTITASIILTLTILLFSAPSPLPLGVLLLLLTLFASLLIASFTLSWFGFILFLIYVGGLLVMFAYFTALCPNHPIIIKHTLSTTLASLLFCLSALQFLFPILPSLTLNPPSVQHTTPIYFSDNMPALLLLILILFLILITVVTSTRHSQGPLRPFH